MKQKKLENQWTIRSSIYNCNGWHEYLHKSDIFPVTRPLFNKNTITWFIAMKFSNIKRKLLNLRNMSYGIALIDMIKTSYVNSYTPSDPGWHCVCVGTPGGSADQFNTPTKGQLYHLTCYAVLNWNYYYIKVRTWLLVNGHVLKVVCTFCCLSIA